MRVIDPLEMPETVLFIMVVSVPIVTADILMPILLAWRWERWFIFFGLLMDVFGAISIAIPEMRLVDPYNLGGGLKSANAHLKEVRSPFDVSWIKPGIAVQDQPDLSEGGFPKEKGFDALHKYLRRYHSRKGVLPTYSGDPELKDIVWDDIILFIAREEEVAHGSDKQFYMRVLSEPLPDFIDDIEQHTEFVISVNLLTQIIDQKVAEQDGRVIRIGVSLLSIGFLHQLITYAI